MYTLPAEPPHTESGPFMEQVGTDWTLREREQLDMQPLASVMVTNTAILELLLTVTVTEEPVLLPFMEQLAETPHW